MIDWSKQPVTRRTFAISLLIAPIACLGCGGNAAVVTEGGDKRRQKLRTSRRGGS